MWFLRVIALLLSVCFVSGCEEIDFPAVLVFRRHVTTPSCDGREPVPVLRCGKRCGYEKYVAPIVCKNIGDNPTLPLWQCATEYRFSSDPDLGLRKTVITCQGAPTPGKIYKDTCVLEYDIGKDSDYEPFPWGEVAWIILVFFVWLCCVVGNERNGGSSTSVHFVPCPTGSRRSGGSGGSSSFAVTRMG